MVLERLRRPYPLLVCSRRPSAEASSVLLVSRVGRCLDGEHCVGARRLPPGRNSKRVVRCPSRRFQPAAAPAAATAARDAGRRASTRPYMPKSGLGAITLATPPRARPRACAVELHIQVRDGNFALEPAVVGPYAPLLAVGTRCDVLRDARAERVRNAAVVPHALAV